MPSIRAHAGPHARHPAHGRTQPATVLDAYLAAWNSADALQRHRHLQAAWADGGRFQDPWIALEGRAAMAAWMAALHRRHAARFVVLGDVDQHGVQLHFVWALFDRRGFELLNGRSFCTLDAEGRIARLVSFNGRLPLSAAAAAAAVAALAAEATQHDWTRRTRR